MDRVRDAVLVEMAKNGRGYTGELKSIALELQQWRAGKDPTEEEKPKEENFIIQVPLKRVMDYPRYESPSNGLGAIDPGGTQFIVFRPLSRPVPLYTVVYRVR